MVTRQRRGPRGGVSRQNRQEGVKGSVLRFLNAACVLSWLAHPLLASASSQGLFRNEVVARPSRNYDVLHYRIAVSFDEARKRVSGATSIRFTPLTATCDSVWFDAVAMNVRRVLLQGGTALRFRYDSTKVTILLDRRYSFDDTVTLSIEYACEPRKGLYFVQPDSTDPTRRSQIWTQGEDMDNRCWFPCYDFPDDKATSEVIATVRQKYRLLSNGRLLGVKQNPEEGTTTYHWYESIPHASYLIMIAAGEYEVLRDRYRDVPLEYYVYPDRVEDSRRSYARTPAMMKFFEETIGAPYPWEKLAQITVNDFMWGGMENASAVTLNENVIHDPRAAIDFTGDETIAHEVAHQWWGNVVTCRDWQHLWLNEGFATYFEAIYRRHARGDDEFQYAMMESARNVVAVERAMGRRPIVSAESFPTNLYGKGAWVLYMLQGVVGEKEFFRGINYYLRRHQYSSVDTRDFQRAMEDATGQNLEWFFEQWLTKGGHPELVVRTGWSEEGKQASVRITQTQPVDSATALFRLPLEIEFTTPAGKTSMHVWLTKAEEEFTVSLDGKPLMVIVDKGMKTLKSLTFERTREEYLYAIRNAADVVERITAAKALRRYPGDTAVFGMLRQCAVGDPFWGVRREATISLGVMQHDSLKQALFDIYADKNSAVRGAAIVALEKFPDAAQFLRSAAQKDSSYVVLGYCIQSLAKVDSVHALEMAGPYLDVESYRDIVRRSALQVLRELSTPRSIPLVSRFTRPGNAADIRMLALNIIGESGEHDVTARKILFRLAYDHDPSLRSTVIRILGMWGDDEARRAIEQRKTTERDETVLSVIEEALNPRHP